MRTFIAKNTKLRVKVEFKKREDRTTRNHVLEPRDLNLKTPEVCAHLHMRRKWLLNFVTFPTPHVPIVSYLLYMS